MPSIREKKPKRRSDSRWYKAKHFGIRNSEMNDMKDNAKIKRSKQKANASILNLIMVDRVTGGSHGVDQGEANGLYDNHRRRRFH